MNKKVFILFVLAFLVGWFYVTWGFHFLPNPYIDTKFAPGFTFEKFEQIKTGMKPEGVRSILGEPISRFNFGLDCWQYSTDGAASPLDFSWYRYLVCFKNGAVNSKPVFEFSD